MSEYANLLKRISVLARTIDELHGQIENGARRIEQLHVRIEALTEDNKNLDTVLAQKDNEIYELRQKLAMAQGTSYAS